MQFQLYVLVVLSVYVEACDVPTRPGTFDTLKVTWKSSVSDPNGFNNLPRTVNEALAAGWVLDVKCSDTKPFLGNRYVKDGDTSAMVLFDKNGFIAGLQVGIPKNLLNNIPSDREKPPFVEYRDQYVVTAYFVEPSWICSNGRTAREFAEQGTGTGIWFQNSTYPLSNLVKAPATELLAEGTSWTKGKCFRSMGTHYWYNTTLDMNCGDFQPFFLLYNMGHLDAFGWALYADLPSPRYEKPTFPVVGQFMEEVPICIAGVGQMSTMHVSLSENAVMGNCEDCRDFVYPNGTESLKLFCGRVPLIALLMVIFNLRQIWPKYM